MEQSPNINVIPMPGTIERETRRKAREAMATRAVIAGLQEIRRPGEIGSVLLPHEYEMPDPSDAA